MTLYASASQLGGNLFKNTAEFYDNSRPCCHKYDAKRDAVLMLRKSGINKDVGETLPSLVNDRKKVQREISAQASLWVCKMVKVPEPQI